jgi:hypothetical protein
MDTKITERFDQFDQKQASFEKKLESFEQKQASFEKKLESFEQKLESFDQKQASFEKKLESIEQKQASFEKNQTYLQKTMEKNHSEVSKVLTVHSRMLMNMAAGMGINFERYNADWLKKYLRDTIGKDVDVFVGYQELDKHKEIHENNTRVEIDIFVDEPFIIGEATTYLGENEWQKIINFHKIGEWLGRKYDEKPRMLLFCMAIHPKLRSQVEDYCKAHGIELFCQIKSS